MKENKPLLNCPICNAEPRNVSFGIECPQCGLWLPIGSKWSWNDRNGCVALVEELLELRGYEGLNNGG